MRRDELAFTYFPDDYRWSHGLLLALAGAPWGGGWRTCSRCGDDHTALSPAGPDHQGAR